jgi:SAM-dependent methyltransferase
MTLAEGFRDIDCTGDPARFAAYLDAVAEQLAEHKRASYDMLEVRAGQCVLDVGCGTGDDARALAARVAPGGHVIGIDVSARMIDSARARGGAAEFMVADAHTIDLPSDCFDAARVERCLQHVARPGDVIAEMRRVVRPGGWLVAAEPDWGTLVVAGAGRPHYDDHVAHPRIGSELAGLLVAAGLTDLSIRPLTLVTRSLAVACQLFQLGERDELRRRDAAGRFFAALTGFAVRARVP